MNLTALLLFAALQAAPVNPSSTSAQEAALAAAVVAAARHYVVSPPPGPNHCSTFVAAVYRRAGVQMGGSTRDLWARAAAINALHHHARPRVGDLVFFDDTFDANNNRRVDDPLTHVAVVIDIDDDGTITMAHGGATNGRATFHMNLEHPTERTSPDGKRWNDYVRAQTSRDAPGVRYMASELWAGFATVRVQDSLAWAQGVSS